MNEEYLKSVIHKIQQQKEARHIAQNYAVREEIMTEIFKDMQECLTSLLKDKKIDYQKTLNSWAVSITNN